jgi:hypothetical protein
MRATSYTVARRFALIVASQWSPHRSWSLGFGSISESATHAMRRVPEMGTMTDIPPPKSPMLIIILFAIAGAVVAAIAYIVMVF